jgi:hypothetical protein
MQRISDRILTTWSRLRPRAPTKPYPVRSREAPIDAAGN